MLFLSVITCLFLFCSNISHAADTADALFTLSPGWNFISFNMLPSQTAQLNAVLSDISPNVRIAWGYDNQNKKWLKHSCKSQDPASNTLYSFEMGKGYWIYMDASANIDVNGWLSPVPGQMNLYDGWNLVGYQGKDGEDISKGLSTVSDKWVITWTWNQGQWYAQHKSVADLPYQPLSAFNQKKAYWIKINNDQPSNWNQDTVSPGTPTGLNTRTSDAGRINLSWTLPLDNVELTGYKIYRGSAYIDSVTSNSFSDTGLHANTRYCYTVKAYDTASNESGYSDEVCTTTLPADAPTISNLRYSPTYTLVGQGNGTMTVTGAIDFTAPKWDLTALRLTSSGGVDLTVPIAGSAGARSGTGNGAFVFSTLITGTYPFEIWVVDSQGNSSNKLSGVLKIKAADDTGTQWTKRESGTQSTLHSVAWSGKLFVAVGGDGTILASPDGISWVQRSSDTSNTLQSVIWAGTQFVAVGQNGTILTSPDGLTWTKRESGLLHNPLYGIAWSGNQFVAVGTQFDRYYNLIITSPDGITWTNRTIGNIDVPLFAITWSGTQFVAVGTNESSPANATVLTSPDGIRWIQRLIKSPYNTLNGVIWNGSQFIAFGPWDKFFTSTDGANWTSMPNDSFRSFTGMAWSGDCLVAISGYGDRYTSNDGITWTRQYSANLYSSNGIVWSGSKYVAVGAAGTSLTSP